ncbi:MAG TPA: hypothetical protein V6C65_18495, partial [Allocoleopsis sp.]
EEKEATLSDEQVFANFKKTILQVVDPTKADSPEKVEKFTDLRTKVSQAAQSNDDLAKKVLSVTDKNTDDELKALKVDLEQAKGEKKEIAVLIMDIADTEAKEMLALAKAEDATESNSVENEVSKDATSDVATEEQAPVEDASQETPAGETAQQAAPDAAQPSAPAAEGPSYQSQSGEPFSAAQLTTAPAPVLGMETPLRPLDSAGQAPAANVEGANVSAAPLSVEEQPGMFQPSQVPAAPQFTAPANNNNNSSVDNMGSSNGAGAAMQPPVSAYNYNLDTPVEREIE